MVGALSFPRWQPLIVISPSMRLMPATGFLSAPLQQPLPVFMHLSGRHHSTQLRESLMSFSRSVENRSRGVAAACTTASWSQTWARYAGVNQWILTIRRCDRHSPKGTITPSISNTPGAITRANEGACQNWRSCTNFFRAWTGTSSFYLFNWRVFNFCRFEKQSCGFGKTWSNEYVFHFKY